MSSFLDSTGLDRLATKLKAYFMKKPTSASTSSYPLVGYDAESNVGKYNSNITMDMAKREILAGNSTPNLATPTAPYSNDITIRTVTGNVTYTSLYHKPTKDMYVLVRNGGSSAISVIYGTPSSTTTKSLSPGYIVILLYTTSNETWSLVGEPMLADHWPGSLPCGYASFAETTTGYKDLGHVKPFNKLSGGDYNGDSLVSFDVYEFNAGGNISYRGVLNVGSRRDGDTYSFRAFYVGFQLANTTLNVRYSNSTKKILIFAGKTNNVYCGIKIVPKMGGNWDQYFDYTNIELNHNPSTESIDSYPEVTMGTVYLPNSNGTVALQNGSYPNMTVGKASSLGSTPVGSSDQWMYLDSSGLPQQAPWFQWTQIRQDNSALGCPPALPKSSLRVSIPANSTRWVRVCGQSNIGGIFWFGFMSSNNPRSVCVEYEWFTYGSGGIRELNKTGYTNATYNSIQEYAIVTLNSGSKVCFFVKIRNYASSEKSLHILSTKAVQSSDIVLLTESEFESYGTSVVQISSSYNALDLNRSFNECRNGQLYAAGTGGSPTLPVYVDTDGTVKACNTYISMGTAVADSNVLCVF